MRVFIITGIFPPDIGGPATYVPQIAKGLTERGHIVTVVTLSDRLDHEDKAYPFRVIRLLRKRFKPLRMLQTICTIWHFGRQADVLFINGLALEAVLANLLLRKPLVMKVVGDFAWERALAKCWAQDDFEVFQKKRYDWRIEALKLLRSWWTRRVDRVIVPSRYLAGCVEGWGIPLAKIQVIYNAVEIPNGIRPAKLPLETSFNVVTAGRLVPWKRIDKIIEAISWLEDVGLVVVGDGPERERLERWAQELKVSDRVLFAGQRSQEETLAFMAACDAFVLNSTYEGLPHVLIEAMKLGLPVVATAVGGTPEVVQDRENGFLIRPSNGRYLSSVIQRLVRDQEGQQRFIQKARRMINEKFGLKTMLDRTEATLSTV